MVAFLFHLLASHKAICQNEQFVIEADGLINAGTDFIACFHMVRSKPATYAFALQIGVQTFGKVLVLARIADEAGIVAYWCVCQGTCIGDESVTESCSAQENLRNVAARTDKSVNANGRRPDMSHCLKPPHLLKVDVSNISPTEYYFTKISAFKFSITQLSKTKVCSVEVGVGKVGSESTIIGWVFFFTCYNCHLTYVCIVEVSFTEIGSHKISPEEACSSKCGMIEIGISEFCAQQVGILEAGISEIGFVEIDSYEAGIAEINPTEVSTLQVSTTEVCVTKISIFEINFCIWVVFSPFIPGVYSLMEYFQLMLICHNILPFLLCLYYK